MTSFYVKLAVAPAATKSWQFIVRKNGVDTALSVTISNPATSANVTGDISFANGDLMSIKSVPTNNPSGTIDPSFGYGIRVNQGQSSFLRFFS